MTNPDKPTPRKPFDYTSEHTRRSNELFHEWIIRLTDYAYKAQGV